MAETAINVTTGSPFGENYDNLQSSGLTVTDETNNNFFYHPGGDVWLVGYNGSAGALTIVVESFASSRSLGREGDKTLSLAAGGFGMVKIPHAGFANADGKVILTIADDGTDTLEAGIFA